MKVKITEILERVVEVDSIEEAELMYKRSEIILDSSDFVGVDFTEVKEEALT